MISISSDQTKQIAQDILKNLKGKRVIALYGDLGSGKTTFSQGIAQALGIEARVISPTFVLLRSYPTKSPLFQTLHHLDLYRATNLKAAKTSGIEEILADENALVLIEWPETIEELLPKNTLRVKMKTINENEREVELK